MATGGDSNTDTERRARLCKLLLDEGTELLRKIFDAEVLKKNPKGLRDLLKERGKLKGLYEDQEKTLYPPGTEPVDSSKDFDITLLYDLLRKLCGWTAPPSWGKPPKPPPGDTSIEAWVMRFYLFRNRVYGHIPRTSLSESVFDEEWDKLSEILIALGGNQSNIQEIKVEIFTREQIKKYLGIIEQQEKEVLALLTAQSAEVSSISENLQKQTVEIRETREELSDRLENLEETIITELKEGQQANNAGGQTQSVEMKTSGKELHLKYTWTTSGQKHMTENTAELQESREGHRNTAEEIRPIAGGKMPPTIQKLCTHLQDRYRRELRKIKPLPWCEDFYLNLEHMFTTLEMVGRDGLREDTKVDAENMFQSDNARIVPKTIRIEGNPGIGKTTLCYKIVYDCSAENSKFESDNKFASFQLVLYVEMRKVPHDATDLKSTIFQQVFPSDHYKHEEEFWNYVRSNPQSVLFVLDGLDEMPEETRQHLNIREFIRGQIIPDVHVIVTSRPYLCSQQLTSCNRHFVIKGYSQDNIKSYINRHKKLDRDSKQGMLKQLNRNESLHQLTKNPLNLALFCILWQKDWSDAVLPQTLTGLYSLLVLAIIKRYASNCLGINKLSGTCLEEIKEPQIRGILNDLNQLAWKGIQEDRLNFTEEEVGSLVGNIIEIGFLTKDLNVANPLQTYWFQFLHKTFQEYFAAWYLHSLCVATIAEENTSTLFRSVASYMSLGTLDTHPSKQALMNTLKECVEQKDRYQQVLKFLAGLLGTNAPCLFIAFHDFLGKKHDESIASLCLECLHECGAGTELVRYVSDVLPRDWRVGSEIAVTVTGTPELLSHLHTTKVPQSYEHNTSKLKWYEYFDCIPPEHFGSCHLSCNTYTFSDEMQSRYNTYYIRSNEALYGLVYLLQYQAKTHCRHGNLQLSSVELRYGLDNSAFLKAIKNTKVVCFLALDITNCDNEFIKETCNLFKSDAYKDLPCKVSMSPSGNSSLDNLNKVLSSVPAHTELSLYSSVHLDERDDSTNKHTFSRVIDTTVRLGSVRREREASIKLSIDCAAETCKYETEFVASFMQNLVITLKECQSLHQPGSLELLVIVRNLPLVEKDLLQPLLDNQVSSLLQDNYCILSKMAFECSCEDGSVVSTIPLLQCLALNQSLTEVSILCDDPESVAKCLCDVFAKNRILEKLKIGFLHPVDDKTMSKIFSSYPDENQGQIISFSVFMETGRNTPLNSTTVISNLDSYEQTVKAILSMCKNLTDGSVLQTISFISGPGNTLMKTGDPLYRVHRVIPVCPGSLLKPLVEAIVDSQLTVNLEGITWEDVADVEVTEQERTRYSNSEHLKKSSLGNSASVASIKDLFVSTKVTDSELVGMQLTPEMLTLYK